MTGLALSFLCDPATQEGLELSDAQYDGQGNIVSGQLRSPTGKVYPIIDGIPRFCSDPLSNKEVESFGEQWNYFNFTEFKANWLEHTVKNTFGSIDVLRGKVIVDAGGGSGAQSLWMLQGGAKHVFLIELSNSVDNVIKKNLRNSGFANYDIIQASIDLPPFRKNSIDGIVICHNVIQHTKSVVETAKALFRTLKPGSEFVFNCYMRFPEGFFSGLAWAKYRLVRAVVSRLPFGCRLAYARTMAFQGTVRHEVFAALCSLIKRKNHEAVVTQGTWRARVGSSYRNRVVNIFDAYGAHKYQHHLSESELRDLLSELQPDPLRILNVEAYFKQPPPLGCALRVFKSLPS